MNLLRFYSFNNIIYSFIRGKFPFIYFSNLLIVFEVKLLTNLGKLSLAKGIAMFVCAFFFKIA